MKSYSNNLRLLSKNRKRLVIELFKNDVKKFRFNSKKNLRGNNDIFLLKKGKQR